MLHLYRCPIGSDDASRLVARLYQDAHPAAVSAALAIEKVIDRELYAVALMAAPTTAILGVPEPPEGLCELRGGAFCESTAHVSSMTERRCRSSRR
jgi:hypothetical protein